MEKLEERVLNFCAEQKLCFNKYLNDDKLTTSEIIARAAGELKDGDYEKKFDKYLSNDVWYNILKLFKTKIQNNLNLKRNKSYFIKCKLRENFPDGIQNEVAAASLCHLILVSRSPKPKIQCPICETGMTETDTKCGGCDSTLEEMSQLRNNQADAKSHQESVAGQGYGASRQDNIASINVCGVCGRENPLNEEDCIFCIEAKAASPPGGSQPSNVILAHIQWHCDTCSFVNKKRDRQCTACNTPRNAGNNPTAESLPDPNIEPTQSWICPGCSMKNPTISVNCTACYTPNPTGPPGKLKDEAALRSLPQQGNQKKKNTTENKPRNNNAKEEATLNRPQEKDAISNAFQTEKVKENNKDRKEKDFGNKHNKNIQNRQPEKKDHTEQMINSAQTVADTGESGLRKDSPATPQLDRGAPTEDDRHGIRQVRTSNRNKNAALSNPGSCSSMPYNGSNRSANLDCQEQPKSLQMEPQKRNDGTTNDSANPGATVGLQIGSRNSKLSSQDTNLDIGESGIAALDQTRWENGDGTVQNTSKPNATEPIDEERNDQKRKQKDLGDLFKKYGLENEDRKMIEEPTSVQQQDRIGNVTGTIQGLVEVGSKVTTEVGGSQEPGSKNVLGQGQWNCVKCTFLNGGDSVNCGTCGDPNEKAIENPLEGRKKSEERSTVAADLESQEKWSCWKCQKKMDYDKFCCSCGEMAPFFDKWSCEGCSFYNKKMAEKCEVCGKKNCNLVPCSRCKKKKVNKLSDTTCDNCLKVIAEEDDDVKEPQRGGSGVERNRWENSSNTNRTSTRSMTDRTRNSAEEDGRKPSEIGTVDNARAGRLFRLCDNCHLNRCKDAQSRMCPPCIQKCANARAQATNKFAAAASLKDTVRVAVTPTTGALKCKKCDNFVCVKMPYCADCCWPCTKPGCGSLNYPQYDCCRSCRMMKGARLVEGSMVDVKSGNGAIVKMWCCTYRECRTFVAGKMHCTKCNNKRCLPPHVKCPDCGWVTANLLSAPCEKCRFEKKKTSTV